MGDGRAPGDAANDDAEWSEDPDSLRSSDAGADGDPASSRGEFDVEELAEEYDFDDFGPDQMARMSAEEWDAAFDPDSWITGPELLDRVERDLKVRIADRDVFAVVDRLERDGVLLAYSDEGYAIVYPDGSVEGRGTVLRDVKPSVALCSMEGYDVEDPPEDWELPTPEEVPTAGSELGNQMLQVVAFGLLFAGVVMFVGSIVGATGRAPVIVTVIGLCFVGASVFLFLLVANARLSDRFRASEYRNRLRAAGVESREPPEFVPVEDGRLVVPEEGDGDPERR